MAFLVKSTRHCVREEEGSGEKASIYMILAPTLVLRTTAPATPPRITVTLFPTKAELLRDSYLPCLTITPRFLQGDRLCVGTASGTCLLLAASASCPSGSAYPIYFTKYFSCLPLPNSLASRISSTTNSSSSFTITGGGGGTSCPRYGFSAAFSGRETW